MLKRSLSCFIRETHAQTAIEYMLLFAVVVAIVLAGFQLYVPLSMMQANALFSNVTDGIMGEPPRCGDGFCSSFENADGYGGRANCPVDCGNFWI